MDGIISGVSIAHDKATLDQLEAATHESEREAVETLLARPAVEEAFAIQTCNRVEGYVVTGDEEAGRDVLGEWTGETSDELIRELDHEGSLRHLLRVGAGLESLVLGEDQILGQLRDAFETARETGGIGPLLEEGLTKAIRVGERARTETAINEGVVSLASAAVRLADEKHGLEDTTVIVIGAGEMGTIAAKRIVDRAERLVVANRTPSRARRIVKTIQPTDTELVVEDLASISQRIVEAEIVISATGSSDTILHKEAFAAAGETFVIDIAQPRDISSAVDGFDHLTLYDLDELESVTQKTRLMRRNAAQEVDEIVTEEFERLLAQYKRQRADTVISAMYESAERVKSRELETALEKLDLDGNEEAVVESMADAIVSEMLSAPTRSLRDAAENDNWSTIHTALQLFDPSVAAASPEDGGSGPQASSTPSRIDMEDIPPQVRDRLSQSVLEQPDD
jgi:glutamyl-tRNA reductase